MKEVKIESISAREILDSRGNPTIQVEVVIKDGTFIASVPSGASTGKYEALELRDNDSKRYNGKGVLKAVHNVNTIISQKLIGMNVLDQKKIDETMILLDGTKNKSKLGANAILGVSMAVCRAGAFSSKLSLYEYIAKLSLNKKFILPVPSFNVINGGRHAGNKLVFQEFMILPVFAESFSEAMKIGDEVYNKLKEIISKQYGKNSTSVGDEGGFAPDIGNKDAFLLLVKAIKLAGYTDKVRIGVDFAASEFYDHKTSCYNLNFKGEKADFRSKEEMIELYLDLIDKYDIISLEDPFDQDDFESYKKFNKKVGESVQIVGDDLLVTNVLRIKEAISKKLCNTLLLKINQIGTISEAILAYKLAKKANWNVMVSHRSGETEDSFIADLCVGLSCGEIKSGAPARGERLAKYNRLLKIEEELIKKGYKINYFGKKILK